MVVVPEFAFFLLLNQVLFNKCHHRINLIAFLLYKFVFKRLWHTQNFQILSIKGTSHTNSDSEWGNESFVQQILPWNKSGGTFVLTRNKTTYSEFKNLKI
jgi:hypothetical protein